MFRIQDFSEKKQTLNCFQNKNSSITQIYRIQTIGWPRILRGSSMVFVNSAKSGKTWSYLPAICSLIIVSNSSNYQLPSNSSQLIFLVIQLHKSTSAKSRTFLNSKKKVVEFLKFIDPNSNLYFHSLRRLKFYDFCFTTFPKKERIQDNLVVDDCGPLAIIICTSSQEVNEIKQRIEDLLRFTNYGIVCMKAYGFNDNENVVVNWNFRKKWIWNLKLNISIDSVIEWSRNIGNNCSVSLPFDAKQIAINQQKTDYQFGVRQHWLGVRTI